MLYAVMRRIRPVSLPLCAALLLFSATAFSQDATSITTMGSSNGGSAAPVLLGNNAGNGSRIPAYGTTPALTKSAPTYTPATSSGYGSDNAFVKLMNQANANMVANANAYSEAREKRLAAEANARNQAAEDAMNGGASRKKKQAADDGLIIMHYQEPNDTGAPPPRTFHIE